MFRKFHSKRRVKKSAVTIKNSVRPCHFSNAKRKKNLKIKYAEGNNLTEFGEICSALASVIELFVNIIQNSHILYHYYIYYYLP